VSLALTVRGGQVTRALPGSRLSWPVGLLQMCVLAVLANGCRRGSPLGIGVGDTIPVSWDRAGLASVVVVARPTDCFGCWLQQGFAAVRVVHRPSDERKLGVPVTVLVVTTAGTDTTVVAGYLRRERIAARHLTMTPAEAADVFGQGQLPAIYLMYHGRVVREWVGGGRAPAEVQRRDLGEALIEVSRVPPFP